MKRVEVIRATAAKADMTIKDTKLILDTFFDLVEETLIAGDFIDIHKFGRFYTITDDARSRRNPSNGEMIDCPETRRPRFKYSMTVRRKLNE